MSENKGGRRKITLTDEEVAKIEDLAARLNIEQIADYFGICEKTFREIRDRDFTVFTAYKKGKAKSIEHVASKLMQNINNNDTTSIIFYLKTQAGWIDKQQLEVTNKNIDLPVMVKDTKDSYEDEIVKRFEKNEGETIS